MLEGEKDIGVYFVTRAIPVKETNIIKFKEKRYGTEEIEMQKLENARY